MSLFKFGLAALIVLGIYSCSVKYAKVRVVTNDPVKGSVTLKILDAKSGLILDDGNTPAEFILTKKSSDKNPTLSVIVYEKCYPVKWKLVEITRWTKKKTNLSDVAYLNEIHISVVEVKDCIWDTYK